MRFRYRTHSLPVTCEVLDALSAKQDGSAPKGSYLSDDAAVRAVLWTLENGYRWIRTDDLIAVFELDSRSIY